ncbi:MAG: glycosyltransferase family 4 protein [Roseburia sp.]|nr:glycosyltransferase family 4 protein [Roseburia sp.]MCM1277885.1 glycosyltransferase family 4 protein [Robinsoniella sp.]
MDILIIAHYMDVPNSKGNSRFSYLANQIVDYTEKNKVEVVTSSFSHRLKKQKEIGEMELKETKYNLTICYEPGYTKNVCLKRLHSHNIFGKNLEKYLEERQEPDLIYCAVPSLDAAYAAWKYAQKRKVKFMIDIQDLWPEAFEMVFHVPLISRLIFTPMKRKADKIYSNADEIIAVSDTYAQRAKSVNHKVRDTYTVFLGRELKKFDLAVKRYRKAFDFDTVRLAYCGTLGHSYDLRCVVDALEILKKRKVDNVELVIMGDGPLRQEFEQYAASKGIRAVFTGYLEYEKMCGLLASCDIAVNPISHRAAQSIINKHADYAAAGIPVVSTQENEEYKNLVEIYHMGFNCINGDAGDLAEKIEMLVNDVELRKKMGKNARRCAQERFDREKSYKELVKKIIC